MPEEIPVFTSQPLPKEPKKRSARPSTRRRSPRATEGGTKREIDEQLASIYLNDKGEMPDMKQINSRPSHPIFKTLLVVLGLGALLSAVAWLGFFWSGLGNFSDQQITLTVTGPAEISLGATSTYTIAYANNQTYSLKNAAVIIRYPEGFVFVSGSLPTTNVGHNQIDLGTIPPNEQKAITITGKSYGAPKQEQSWRVFLNYQPQNLNSELQKVAILTTAIGPSPISLSLTGPASATAGTETEYAFAVNLGGDWRPAKLEVAPNFPANFYFSSSTPALGKNNRWLVSITPSTTAANLKFIARGKFSDTAENILPIKGSLYLPLPDISQNFSIAETSLNTELLKSDLAFNLAINGSTDNLDTHPGDLLNITINLKNSSSHSISNAVITLTLDTPSANRLSLLNWSAIGDKNDGSITGKQLSDSVRRGEIAWNNKKIPSLANLKPGDEVSVDLRLPVKDKNTANFDLGSLTEYKMPVTAEVKFTDAGGAEQSLSANPIMINVNSDLKFETRDAVSTDSDGHEVHALEWVLNNSFHPLKNITLTADVYGDIAFPTASTTPAGVANFDLEQKKITWNVPEMPESVDVLAWPFTLTINKKNPSQSTLVSKVHVQAVDAVTGQNLDFMGDETPLTPAQ